MLTGGSVAIVEASAAFGVALGLQHVVTTPSRSTSCWERTPPGPVAPSPRRCRRQRRPLQHRTGVLAAGATDQSAVGVVAWPSTGREQLAPDRPGSRSRRGDPAETRYLKGRCDQWLGPFIGGRGRNDPGCHRGPPRQSSSPSSRVHLGPLLRTFELAPTSSAAWLPRNREASATESAPASSWMWAGPSPWRSSS